MLFIIGTVRPEEKSLCSSGPPFSERLRSLTSGKVQAHNLFGEIFFLPTLAMQTNLRCCSSFQHLSVLEPEESTKALGSGQGQIKI